jgi:hypothetical protein
MNNIICSRSRPPLTVAVVVADGRVVAAGEYAGGAGSVHGVHEATGRGMAVNGRDGAVNPVNTAAHRADRVNARDVVAGTAKVASTVVGVELVSGGGTCRSRRGRGEFSPLPPRLRIPPLTWRKAGWGVGGGQVGRHRKPSRIGACGVSVRPPSPDADGGGGHGD